MISATVLDPLDRKSSKCWYFLAAQGWGGGGTVECLRNGVIFKNLIREMQCFCTLRDTTKLAKLRVQVTKRNMKVCKDLKFNSVKP